MADRPPRFFTNNKRDENAELKADLNSEFRDKRKETVKKVIANMTIGKDVSALFADVVKNMQTEDLELKKLVYLYLINYAKSQPELVILAVNTFVKDSDDHNPLIRALAIRTMGCLRVERIVDYLLEPLKKGLKDEDPYVRKTAALCVAKLFDLNPGIAIDNGLIAILQDMLSDRNPMVIANAVAALTEISEASVQKDIFQITDMLLQKLLAALNECTEWGQICILNSLGGYRPRDAREAGDIVERVIPRLQHVNASVVLSAVKVLMIYLNYQFSDELEKTIVRKLAPPLVTLISSEPEIQYVALRNINLILQKRPDVLTEETRVFFTKFNDPPYVKLEKLEVIIKLCAESNVDQVLSELKEYANEVDVDFVRKSVRAIGRCAIKIPAASDKCVHALLDLLKTGVAYIVQEAIVVMKDVFRKYPTKYEGIIPSLCQNLDALDEPDARASLIWIIGEYADRIENAGELLDHFLESFKDESPKVQLQLITATVKLFLKRPGSAQDLVQSVLQNATQANDNPDIRDRAYVYWRLLSSNPQAAKAIVLAEKPPIDVDTMTVSESLLDELIINISSLASVYHKSPALLGGTSFVDMTLYRTDLDGDEQDPETRRSVYQEAAKAMGSGPIIENLLDLDFGTPAAAPAGVGSSASGGGVVGGGASGIDDLLSMDMDSTMPMGMGGGSGASAFGGLGGLGAGAAAAGITSYAFPKVPLLLAATAQGLDMSGTYVRRHGAVHLDLTVANKAAGPMSDFAIQFNVNTFGLAPAAPLVVPLLQPGSTADVSLPLTTAGPAQRTDPLNLVQIAVKNNYGVFYFQTLVPLHVLLLETPAAAGASGPAFGAVWGDAGAPTAAFALAGFPVTDLLTKLGRNGLHVVQQSTPTASLVSSTLFPRCSWQVYAKTVSDIPIAVEMAMAAGGGGGVNVTAKSRSPEVLALLQVSLDGLLR
ncbi:adaptin N terminal region-domain-containing protein [Entophlyctis helioformis]|nr:adaptin N terminal region-domain-containing protein [Entophlyctis helioformis]